MKFTYLPIPVDDRTPEGYRLIVAYAKGDKVFIPVDLDDNAPHNCDWEGCGSLSHVVRFSVSDKYKTEEELLNLKTEAAEKMQILAVVQEVLEEHEWPDDVNPTERDRLFSEVIMEKIHERLKGEQQHTAPKICVHSVEKWRVCSCKIHQREKCDGKGEYTETGNLGIKYGYQCPDYKPKEATNESQR